MENIYSKKQVFLPIIYMIETLGLPAVLEQFRAY
jgi:hypothetical protein